MKFVTLEPRFTVCTPTVQLAPGLFTGRTHMGICAVVSSCLQSSITDTADMLCGAASLKLSRVRLSVCPSVPSFGCVRFAAVGPAAGDIDRLQHSWSALGNKCEQCHVVSWHRKLNTDCSTNLKYHCFILNTYECICVTKM